MPGVLIELKASKDCSDDDLKKLSQKALEQIEVKKYETELTMKGIEKVFKYGVAFSGKRAETTNL